MDRGSAVQANVPFLRELDNAVEYLIGCRQRGENVYYDFNGHRLYSCDVTIDSAYMDVLGVTKEEDDKIAAEMAKAQTDEERNEVLKKFAEKRNTNQAPNGGNPGTGTGITKEDDGDLDI